MTGVMPPHPVDAVPAESSAGHRPGRDCPCGPTAMRDLATGAISIWRHRSPQPSTLPLRGTSLLSAMDRHEDAGARERRALPRPTGHRPGVLDPAPIRWGNTDWRDVPDDEEIR